MDKCQVDGCNGSVFVKSRGWCRKHYYRWWNHGDPLVATYDRSSGTSLQRWWSKTQPTEACWLWVGSLDRRGYGQFDVIVDGIHRNHRAHRWGYEQLVGPIPDGVEPDHLCRNRACVRPDHLELVSHAENVARGDAGSHNAAKTHCKQGHEFSPENTRMRGTWRECKACERATASERMRRYRARKRAGA